MKKFLPIHTKHCVHSNFFLHLMMIRCGNVSSKSSMIESYSWDYGPEALLFNAFQEKLNSFDVIGDYGIWHCIHWGLLLMLWIAIGTKNSSFISLQVMFFKCDKSTMEVQVMFFLTPYTNVWSPLFQWPYI